MGPSSWTVNTSGIETIQSHTISPQTGYETTISVTEDPNGKWATIKFNNLNLGMDDRFNDNLWGFNAVMGVYFIYLYVEVEQVNGGSQKYWTQEFMKYPFYINSR